MLIPSIDLMGGRIVQLVQGERLAFATDDIDAWVDRFAKFPIVQLIDLDAAKNEGRNDALVRRICASLPCQVGGGVRTIAEAQARLNAGARKVIVGSALFDAGGVRSDKAAEFADAIGAERFIAAVDSRGGQIVIHGWKTTTGVTAVDAVRTLSQSAGGFLATLVDGEGLMGGVDLDAALELRRATSRHLIVAGGIRNMDEVDALHAHGIDAVVGMALYGNPDAFPPVYR
jgi:phosphoribosylformimino-5-aminoimidazole carboxamide ribotide isomerase